MAGVSLHARASAAAQGSIGQQCGAPQPLPCAMRRPAAPQQRQQRSNSSARGVACRVAYADGLDTRTALGRPAVAEPQQHKYLLGELLGTGTAARVVVGTDTATGAQYAVKIQDKQKGTRSRVQQIEAEIAISQKLKHCRHAIKTVDSFEDARHIYVVQELCCGGDLSDLMSAQEGRLSEFEAASVIKCVLEFLADCHAASICYGDVKPNNFCLRSLYPSISHLMNPTKPKGSLEVVAVDFGCCQEVGDACLPDTRVTGTPVYMAPENLKGCHGLEVDVWAAGVMLYQLLSDRFPFWDVDIHAMDSLGGAAIRDGILHGPVLFPLQPWCTSVHPSAQDLITRMLDRNIGRRITAAQALQHPWLAHALKGGAAAAGGGSA